MAHSLNVFSQQAMPTPTLSSIVHSMQTPGKDESLTNLKGKKEKYKKKILGFKEEKKLLK